jgi:hypothetical protein
MKLNIIDYVDAYEYSFKTSWLYRVAVLGFRYEITDEFTNTIYICYK